MFKENKYTKYYFSIINNCTNRVIKGYTENHHIVPKSLGGTDDDTNIVRLTAREHYICHRLLAKMTSGKFMTAMIFAVWSMSNQKGNSRCNRNYHVSSRVYARLKQHARELIRISNTGRKYINRKKPTLTPEAREKMRQRCILMASARKGQPKSEETKQKIRIARAKQDMSHMIGHTVSEETRAKIRKKRALQINIKNQYS